MQCRICGADNPEYALICCKCGVQFGYVFPAGPRYPDTSAPLVFGIIGLALASTVVLSVIGLIFSIIGFVKANNYFNTYGFHTGKTRAGRIISLIGLISAAAVIMFILTGILISA